MKAFGGRRILGTALGRGSTVGTVRGRWPLAVTGVPSAGLGGGTFGGGRWVLYGAWLLYGAGTTYGAGPDGPSSAAEFTTPGSTGTTEPSDSVKNGSDGARMLGTRDAENIDRYSLCSFTCIVTTTQWRRVRQREA